ncbi:MAG: proton-conducting transporter membrane subunit, partial [Candidatus Omnitrophota bacterium]
TKDITKMGGLARTMPLTAVAFALCSLSVMGIPPLGGFFAKFMVMAAAMQKGLLGIGFIFMIGAFMTMLYLMRLFNRIFMGSPVGPLTAGEGPSKPVMVWSVLTLAALSLAGGIFIWVPSGAMFTVARLCMGLGA